MNNNTQLPTEFDFFMDEDTRSKRIGILVMEKRLTPALTQALFRVRQTADIFHKSKISADSKLTISEKKELGESVNKQMREVKWSSLNLMRSFLAQEFIKHFFQYCHKGPLPMMFFNAPFIKDHKTSINHFFDELQGLDIEILKSLRNAQSIFFLDAFNTPAGFKFEKEIVQRNNLSRCYRLDSRAHDLLQMTDLLLGATVYELEKKDTTSKPKLNLIKKFSSYKKYYSSKRKEHNWSPIYIL